MQRQTPPLAFLQSALLLLRRLRLSYGIDRSMILQFMILLIDNYDSFTWNLAHLIGGSGFEVIVKRNDAITTAAALAFRPAAVVLSPGPKTPDQAGICIDLIRASAQERTPVFGVCLGHQAIVQAFGGRIIRATKPMHGKTSRIRHGGVGLFTNLPDGFNATRYHSLIAEKESFPHELDIIATDEDDGEIMAFRHRRFPIAGVQFHPESIASEYGAAIFRNFLDDANIPK